MLGTLRFFLASLVALSHVGWKPMGFHLGISAVVVFYMISGYVVSRLWARLQAQPSPLASFYRDRFLRIYPTYFLFLVLGVVVFVVLRPDTYYLSAAPGVEQLFENLTIIPLNYFMYNESDRFVIMPPAWSLGAELQFYLLLPLLIRFPFPVFVISLGVAVVAQAGLLPREWFTYRLLPGVLHIFMAGVLLGTARDAAQRRFRLGVVWGAYFLGLMLLLASGQLFDNRQSELYVQGMLNIAPELLTGILLGLPLLMILAPLKGNIIDQRLGDFSYGVFLNHFIVYWALSTLDFGFNAPLFMGISFLVAAVGWYAVERPGQKFRYYLRKKERSAVGANKS